MQIGDSPALGRFMIAARRLRQHLHLRAARRRRLGVPGARAQCSTARSARSVQQSRAANRRRRLRRPRASSRARRSPKGRPSRVSRSARRQASNRHRLRRHPRRLRRRRSQAVATEGGAARQGVPRRLQRGLPAPADTGAQVIAGTVLGHVGADRARVDSHRPTCSSRSAPPGLDAPLIDPKPILDGWVALENSSIFRAKGENPFLATSPTVGQVLLESKQQLAAAGAARRAASVWPAVDAQDVQERARRQARARGARVPVGIGPEADGGRTATALRRLRWRSPPTPRAGSSDESIDDHSGQRRPGGGSPGSGQRGRHAGAQAADAAGAFAARSGSSA